MLEKGDKKLTHGWAFYDWANSVYSLVISTAVFPIFQKYLPLGIDGKINKRRNNVVLFPL
jgi:UMF1 family MFS transporter